MEFRRNQCAGQADAKFGTRSVCALKWALLRPIVAVKPRRILRKAQDNTPERLLTSYETKRSFFEERLKKAKRPTRLAVTMP